MTPEHENNAVALEDATMAIGPKATTPETAEPSPTESPTDSSDDTMIGRVFGRYFVEEKIADGGMGSVYRATQLRPVKRAVALKVIRADLASREIIERFEHERQTLASMNHPEIASVLDAGTFENGQPFFAMEFADGVPLDVYCQVERLTVRDRVALIVRVARAIEHAHRQGIVHRDLKPSNILVSSEQGEPVVKVIDFGVAKTIDAATGDGATKAGQVLGTPQFMSPEQARSEEVDARSDVFSLGVILHQLLVGRTPLTLSEEDSLVTTLKRIAEQEPERPSRHLVDAGDDWFGQCRTTRAQLRTAVRGDLDWILLRALASYRTERYATASDFADDLQRHLDDLPVNAAAPTLAYRVRKHVRRHKALVWSVSVIALVMFVAAGVSTVVWWDARQQEIALLESIADEVTAQLTAAEANHEQASESRAFWTVSLTKAESRLSQAEALLADTPGLGLLQQRATTLRTQLDQSTRMEQFALALEAAREQGAGVNPLEGQRDRDAGIERLKTALATLGINPAETTPEDAVKILADVPTAFTSELVESLDFWMNETPTGIETSFDVVEGRLVVDLSESLESGDQILRIEAEETIEDASQLTPVEAQRLLAGEPGTTVKLRARHVLRGEYDIELTRVGHEAYWASRVLERLDPHPWRTKLRRAILTADADTLRELAHGDPVELRQQSTFSLGQLAQKLPQPDRGRIGIEVLFLAQEANPTSYWANLYLGLGLLLHAEETDYIGAVRYLTAASAVHPDSFTPHAALGSILLSMRQNEQGIRALQRALVVAPEHSILRLQLAGVLRMLGRHDEAAEQYELMLAESPDDIGVVHQLGHVYQMQERYDDQISLYEKYATQTPDDTSLQYRLVHVLRLVGREDEAIARCDRVLESHEIDLEGLASMYNFYGPDDQPSYSPVEVRDLMAGGPTSPVQHKLFGYSLLETGEAPAALAAFDESLRLDPDDAETHFFRGRACEYVRDYGQATSSYEAALRLRPDYGRAQNALDALQP